MRKQPQKQLLITDHSIMISFWKFHFRGKLFLATINLNGLQFAVASIQNHSTIRTYSILILLKLLIFVFSSLNVFCQSIFVEFRLSQAVFYPFNYKKVIVLFLFKIFFFFKGFRKLIFCICQRVTEFGYFDPCHILNCFVVASKYRIILQCHC